VAATAPYTLSGTLSFPPDTGQPVVPLPFSASGNFTSKEEALLNLSGSGTKSVDVGTIPGAGAKAIMIKVDAGTGLSPIMVKVNGSATGVIEVSPGGFVVISNPNPVAGITQLDIVYASAATVRITLLGD
jgi:hypothetical protein